MSAEIDIKTVVAVWGAITGTVALTIQALQFRAERPRIKVAAAMAISGQPGRRPSLILTVDVVNSGRRPCFVVGLSIPLPAEADPGMGVSQLTPYMQIPPSEDGRPREVAPGGRERCVFQDFPKAYAARLHTLHPKPAAVEVLLATGGADLRHLQRPRARVASVKVQRGRGGSRPS